MRAPVRAIAGYNSWRGRKVPQPVLWPPSASLLVLSLVQYLHQPDLELAWNRDTLQPGPDLSKKVRLGCEHGSTASAQFQVLLHSDHFIHRELAIDVIVQPSHGQLASVSICTIHALLALSKAALLSL
jgi:hypothetical protein